MLRKLLKYDFRAMWKQFSIIWPAALIIAFINRFTAFQGWGDQPASGWPAAITLSLFFGVMFAMFVASMVFVLTRFYKGLLGDEGYLMHTLPVQAWQLVMSKLLCAVTVTVVNCIVAVLSMFLMMPIHLEEIFDLEMWQIILKGLVQQADAMLYLLEFCIMMLVALAVMLTTVYLAMAIGHLFQRRRVLMSVVAFFGIDIAGNLIISLLGRLGMLEFVNRVLLWNNHASFWVGIVLLLIPAAVMFFATSYILQKRLNLE